MAYELLNYVYARTGPFKVSRETEALKAEKEPEEPERKGSRGPSLFRLLEILGIVAALYGVYDVRKQIEEQNQVLAQYGADAELQRRSIQAFRRQSKKSLKLRLIDKLYGVRDCKPTEIKCEPAPKYSSRTRAEALKLYVEIVLSQREEYSRQLLDNECGRREKTGSQLSSRELNVLSNKANKDASKKFPVDLSSALLSGAPLGQATLRPIDLDWSRLQGDGAGLEGVHLEGANLSDAHLEGADLSAAHLDGADLGWAHLEDANLHWTHLPGANLSQADLQGVFLRWAHLEGARLAEAQLWGADLTGARLNGANLRGARIEGANLYRAHLVGADLSWSHLEGAELQEVDLVGAGLQWANLRGADLWGADLAGANLSDAHLEGADLHGTDLRGADLRRTHLQGANLHGAHIENADLRGADLRGAHLWGLDLVAVDLTGAHLEGVEFEGTELQRACLQGNELEGTNISALGPPAFDTWCGWSGENILIAPGTIPNLQFREASGQEKKAFERLRAKYEKVEKGLLERLVLEEFRCRDRDVPNHLKNFAPRKWRRSRCPKVAGGK